MTGGRERTTPRSSSPLGDPPYQGVLVTPFEELGVGDLSEAVFEIEEEVGSSVAFRFTEEGVTVRKIYSFQ